jgi:hypothetical protein
MKVSAKSAWVNALVIFLRLLFGIPFGDKNSLSPTGAESLDFLFRGSTI